MEILRVFTAGSIDDGKSTLIGRLLFETNSIPKAYIEQVRQQCKRLGLESLDFSFFTDGLKEERERKITMDVAYRYLYTDTYKFILADNPGHLEYARNMITGASRADVAVLLLDAYRGLGLHTLQHLKAIEFLEIPQIILAVNKMDLCHYEEQAFLALKNQLSQHPALVNKSVTWIPVSAKAGDNIAFKSELMPWYAGDHLLSYLEHSKPIVQESSEYSYLIIQNQIKQVGDLHVLAHVFNGTLDSSKKLFDVLTKKELHIKHMHSLGTKKLNYPENSALNIQLQGNTPLEGKLLVTHAEHFTSTKNFTVELYFCENTDLHVSEIVFSGFGQESEVQSLDIHQKMLDFQYHNTEHLKKFAENDWCLGTLTLLQEIMIPKEASKKTFILINKASAKTLAFGKIIS